MTTTDAAGKPYEVVRTYGPTGVDQESSSANHTTGFRSQKHRAVEPEGASGFELGLVVVGIAAALTCLAARRR